jgi:hypothetical protein
VSRRPIARPRVTDNERGAIIATLDGRQVRAWSYQNADERRKKMMYAREYVEGWIEGAIHNTKWELT